MTDPKRRRALCILFWSLTALWLAVIWSMSAQTGAESGGLSGRIAAWLLPWADGRTLAAFEQLLRKGAHMAEYAVLACLFSLALLSSRMPHPVHFALIFSILAAIADECHQLFVPGRAGQAADVAIDVLGAAAGLFLFVLVRRIVRRRRAHGSADPSGGEPCAR